VPPIECKFHAPERELAGLAGLFRPTFHDDDAEKTGAQTRGPLRCAVQSGTANEQRNPTKIPPIVIESGMIKCAKSMNVATISPP